MTQHVENTHRAGLSTTDQVGVARQLTAFGLSVHQIARRTRTKRTDIARAVAVAESELAAKATERYDLTLDQAATLADFFVMWTHWVCPYARGCRSQSVCTDMPMGVH